jgi:four helix bundle protein
MGLLRSYRDLDVWKKSIDLVEAVYRASSSWPGEERFGLTNQARRAAVSIPANLAEGAERHGTGEFLQFIGIAKGSLAELETHLTIAERLGFLPAATARELEQRTAEVGRMLTKSLRSRA